MHIMNSFIRHNSYSLVRLISRESLTWIVLSWVTSKSFHILNSILYFLTLVNSTCKSPKDCIHGLNIITMPFVLFIIVFTYRYWNNLFIQIHLSMSMLYYNILSIQVYPLSRLSYNSMYIDLRKVWILIF